MTDRSLALQQILEGFTTLKPCLAPRTGTYAHSVPSAQWITLGMVARMGCASLKEISTQLRVTPSAATQVVQELVKKGYLKRATDPKDARSVHLTLSPRAHKELGVLQRAALKNFTKLFAVLSDREFSQYVALHQKLVRGCVP